MLTLIVAMLLVVSGSSGLDAVGQSSTVEPEAAQPPAVFTLHGEGGQDGSHIRVEIGAGQMAEVVVVFGNRDEKALRLRTYAANSFTQVNGGFGVGGEDDPLTGPATWFDYPVEIHELEPGEVVNRTVPIRVPEDALPGSYLVGIAVQTAEPLAMPETDTFDRIVRKAIGVTIFVPGPRVVSAIVGEPFIEGDAEFGTIVAPIENNGNIGLRPAGTIALIDPNGDVVMTAPIAMRPVYAGHTTTLEVRIPDGVPAGDYTLTLELGDAETGWSATIPETAVTLAEAEDVAGPDPVEITFVDIVLEPPADPGIPPVYAGITVEITIREFRVPSSRLTLIVSRDGEVVDEVVLSQSLALLDQTTVVELPYIPAAGWQAGTYTFSFLLESVDPESGAVTVLARADADDQFVIS